MSKNIPTFRVTIVGETAAELRASMFEYLGLDKEAGPEQPEEQADFLTQAAARPHTPFVPVPAAATVASASAPFAPPVAAIPAAPTSVPSVAMPAIAPAAPASVVTNDFGFDTKGLPWDERIHSATQAKTKDGSWRYKRGVEDAYISQIENELRQRAGAAPIAQMAAPPIPQPVAPPVAAPALTIVQPVALPPNTPPGFIAPAVAPPAPFPPPAALPSAHTLETFKAHMVKIMSDLINERKLTQDYLNQLKTYFKVEQIWNVNEQQAAELFENFVAHGLIVKA